MLKVAPFDVVSSFMFQGLYSKIYVIAKCTLPTSAEVSKSMPEELDNALRSASELRLIRANSPYQAH